MRRLWGCGHVVPLRHSLPDALVSSTRAGMAIAPTGNLRWVSTAPPLSLLSWSVDATGHTYRRCRRRLSVHERIPLLCSTITEAAPDIVALQDSLPAIAEALCAGNATASGATTNKCGDAMVHVTSGNSKSKPQYDLIGSVRNGRCGYLQLFRRRDSLWGGRLLPHYPSLTVEFTSDARSTSQDEYTSASATTIVDSHGREAAGGIRFVLTNVDLSYRGKSLAVGGKPLVSPNVSTDGSPFTLSVGPSAVPNTRVKGQLDSHRETALMFVSQVARPDVLLGNFFMGRTETMPGYEDAWVLAGAPAEHERTTNTFFRHKYDSETNHFYFLPENIHNAGSTGDTVEIPADTPLGAPLSLGACTQTVKSANSSSTSPGASGAMKPTTGKKTEEEELMRTHHEGRPQVAGRFQRCFFRCLPSRNHKEQHPLFRRYERRQLVVLRSFTEVPLTAEEVKGHHGDSPVRCSASDGYPILVLLS